MNINDYSEQYIKFVSDHFIASMTDQIGRRVIDNVSNIVNKFDVETEIAKQIRNVVENSINSYQSANLQGAQAVGENLITDFSNYSKKYLEKLVTDVRSKVIAEFHNSVNSIDISSMVREQCNIIVSAAIANNTFHFPDKSIPGAAVKHESLQLHAENILPGVISKFASTGIEDLSTSCQVTITDNVSIFENKLIVSQDLEVRGNFIFLGSLDNKFADHVAAKAVAKIEQTYSDGTFDQYVHRVMNLLGQEGLEGRLIKVQGKPLVENSTLNSSITVSNLRKVGLLSELEVAGEVLFDDTLCVRSGHVGINTIDPEYSLDLWDQEIQIVATKRQRDTGFFGTLKNQSLIIGTNGSDQLVLHANGNITVQRLNIGKTNHSSGSFQPTENRQLGDIVWNDSPQVGQPIGWVSLGGARWAKFGIISE